MNSLKSLKVVNFQSHENTVLNLHPGINCIVGISDKGKTALFRALDLLRRNRPAKFKFHSDFANSGITSVAVTTSEGRKVKITKTEKRTKYTLTEGDNVKHWRKLNQTVPDLVTDVLNLTDLNIQWQFDNPFLISGSPGEIARVIHEKTKIDQADAWIKTLNKKITSLKREHQIGDIEVDSLTDQLKAFRGLSKINRLLIRVDRLEAKIQKLEDTYIAIDGLIANILDVEYKIIEQKQYLKAEKQIKAIDEIEGQLEKLAAEQVLIEKTLEVEWILNDYDKERLSLNKQYIQVLKKEKRCPICFNPITTDCIKRITNEINT